MAKILEAKHLMLTHGPFSDGNGPPARRGKLLNKYCVYAIQSDISKRVYIGQTDNLDRRLKEHNDGRVKSTKSEESWKIIAVEFFCERSQARWCENCLKKSKGKRLKWLKKNKV